MIIVKQGAVTQFIEQDSTTLGAGDSVYLDAGVVHASYNDGDETAHLQVVIGPSLGEGGYGLVDVSGEEPWASLALAARVASRSACVEARGSTRRRARSGGTPAAAGRRGGAPP